MNKCIVIKNMEVELLRLKIGTIFDYCIKNNTYKIKFEFGVALNCVEKEFFEFFIDIHEHRKNVIKKILNG